MGEEKIYLLVIGIVFAYTGRTNLRGCHTCRTNCGNYGLAYGEYHCHDGSSSKRYSKENSTTKGNYGVQSNGIGKLAFIVGRDGAGF